MNKKYAFSLIEVMIALLVAALIITPLSRLVMRAVTLIYQKSTQLNQYVQLQSFLYESRLQDSISLEFNKEEVLTPRKTIKYVRSAVSEKSILQGKFLTKETVVIEDKDIPENRQDRLISFFTILPAPKKKGDEKSQKESVDVKTTADKPENKMSDKKDLK